MINAIEYFTERQNGARHSLAADKDVRRRNAWHLRTVEGNGLAPAGIIGKQTYGLHGSSYHGLTVDPREIGVELYADGYSQTGCQELLDGARHAVTTGFDGLGVLRLTNARGQVYRIGAKCVEFEAKEMRRRVAAVSAVFECPNPYFEDDVLHVLPVFNVLGGKAWPLVRPYSFAEIQGGAAGTHALSATNDGDTAAPVTLKLSGTSLKAVTVTNNTTGASVVVSGLGGVAGLEICTDPYNAYARLADGGDASRYVSLFSSLADFALAPGLNALTITMTADGLNAAGTQLEWRGRYATCL